MRRPDVRLLVPNTTRHGVRRCSGIAEHLRLRTGLCRCTELPVPVEVLLSVRSLSTPPSSVANLRVHSLLLRCSLTRPASSFRSSCLCAFPWLYFAEFSAG